MDRTVALERSRIASRTTPECFRAGDKGSSAGVGYVTVIYLNRYHKRKEDRLCS
jgi:hypothetical protein